MSVEWELLKTHRKRKCCVGTYSKRKENIRVECEPMENAKKTQICNTQRKRVFCILSNGKHKENIGVAWEPMENEKKT